MEELGESRIKALRDARQHETADSRAARQLRTWIASSARSPAAGRSRASTRKQTSAESLFSSPPALPTRWA